MPISEGSVGNILRAQCQPKPSTADSSDSPNADASPRASDGIGKAALDLTKTEVDTPVEIDFSDISYPEPYPVTINNNGLELFNNVKV